MLRKYARYQVKLEDALSDVKMYKLLKILAKNSLLGVRDLGTYFGINDCISMLLFRLMIEGYARYMRLGRKKIYFLTDKGKQVLKQNEEKMIFSKEGKL